MVDTKYGGTLRSNRKDKKLAYTDNIHDPHLDQMQDVLNQQLKQGLLDISDLQVKVKKNKDTIDGIAVSGGASVASAVTYDNTTSGLESENIQNAIDELVNNLGHYETNEEWLRLYLDKAGHILWGIRVDGSIEWSVGIPTPIQKKLNELISSDDTIKQTISELREYTDQQLATKVDKEEGKSLIDDEVKDCFKIVENDEFIHCILDAEEHILFAIRRDTGKPYFPLNEMYHVEQNEEFFALWKDSANHILMGIRRDGVIVGEINACNVLKKVIENIQSDVAELQSIEPSLKELLNTFTFQENDEFLAIERDAEGKILSSTNADGSHYIHNAKSETIPTEFSHIDDPEGRLEITRDAEGKILSFRDKEGTLHENSIESKELLQNGKKYNLKDFVNEDIVDEKISKNNNALTISEINGVIDHGKQNLLIKSECTTSYSDGVNTFSPPNAGYILSNPIKCNAGETFTRSGTATGMVIVSDKDDKNAKRLMPDGQLPGSTLQIPYDWDWASYVRFAVQESAINNIVISKGTYIVDKSKSGDYCTIDRLKIQSFNLSNDVAYIKSTDGKYFQLYIDASDNYSIKAKEIDVSIIQPNNLPSDWVSLTYSGTFQGLFDRFVICNNKYLLEMSEKGITKLKNIGVTTYPYNNAEHYYDKNGDGRYATSLQGATRKDTVGVGFCLFDDNMVLIEKDLNAFGKTIDDSNWSKHLPDHHDFVYVEDGHYIFFEIDNQEVAVEGFGTKRLNGYLVHEVKKINGVYKIIGEFSTHDYPKLYTDIYDNPDINLHMNTIALDYDGNLLMNFRDANSFVKVRRVINNDGTVTIGSKTKDYSEAIIGRVGGQRNGSYLDSKRILPEGFTFTDIPTSSNISKDDIEDWQWFHSHDVKYWGKKSISGKEYPTYTMFDNNYWTREKYGEYSQNQRNNYKNNPTCNGWSFETSKKSDSTYLEKTISRLVQLSIDWENKKIVDYKVYEMPEYFSQEMSGATMLTEGIFALSFSYMGVWGVYDFMSDIGTTTTKEGNTYKGAKKLFEAQYDSYRYCYRANVYKLNN